MKIANSPHAVLSASAAGRIVKAECIPRVGAVRKRWAAGMGFHKCA